VTNNNDARWKPEIKMRVSLGVPYELQINNNNNVKTTPVRLFPSISEYTVCLVFMKFCTYKTTDYSLHRHPNIVTFY